MLSVLLEISAVARKRVRSTRLRTIALARLAGNTRITPMHQKASIATASVSKHIQIRVVAIAARTKNMMMDVTVNSISTNSNKTNNDKN